MMELASTIIRRLNGFELSTNRNPTWPSSSAWKIALQGFSPGMAFIAIRSGIGDLNVLAAAFAVMRWKRMCGFYRDEADEHQSVYDIGANRLHIA